MTALALTGDVRGLDAHLVGAVRASKLLDGLHTTHHARIKPQLLHSHEKRAAAFEVRHNNKSNKLRLQSHARREHCNKHTPYLTKKCRAHAAARALSADHGSSMVRWMRRRLLAASADACRLMPVLAASDTIATSFSPRMNAAAGTAHTQGRHRHPLRPPRSALPWAGTGTMPCALARLLRIRTRRGDAATCSQGMHGGTSTPPASSCPCRKRAGRAHVERSALLPCATGRPKTQHRISFTTHHMLSTVPPGWTP